MYLFYTITCNMSIDSDVRIIKEQTRGFVPDVYIELPMATVLLTESSCENFCSLSTYPQRQTLLFGV